MNDKVRVFVEQIAKRKALSDNEDFVPDKYCGGNYNDAYYGGVSDGETFMARKILELLNLDNDNKRE